MAVQNLDGWNLLDIEGRPASKRRELMRNSPGIPSSHLQQDCFSLQLLGTLLSLYH
jgi:hypothetical protein